MASHHHHHQCHNNHLSSSSCSCCCCCSCKSSSHPSQISQSPTTDPLLQAIASQILQSSQTHLYAQYLKPQQQHQFHQKHLYQKQQQHQQTQSLLSSLLTRIDALESSLHQIPSHPPPPSISLRDIAARTIQTHFRAFLVRRSLTLRQLKDLAFIKASLNSLKSSISDGSQLKPEILSQKAMDLLLKLDSIQGGDPMIRDGKKSVSRELVRFLEFVDGLSTKRQELSSKSLRLGENSKKSRVFVSSHDPGMGTYQRDLSGEQKQRELLEKLSSQELEAFHQVSDDDPKRDSNYGGILVKRSALESKTKKNVSFAENGNLIRVFEGTHETFSGGQQFPGDDQRELMENLCSEVEEIGGFSRVAEDNEEEDAYMESNGFHKVTDGDRNPRRILQREVNYGKRVQLQGQNGEIAFSAPLPVQMEPIIREARSRR